MTRKRGGEKATEVMRSALSACIISLRLVDVVPRRIHDRIDKSSEGRSIKLNTTNKNVAMQEMLENLQSRCETVTWRTSTPG